MNKQLPSFVLFFSYTFAIPIWVRDVENANTTHLKLLKFKVYNSSSDPI